MILLTLILMPYQKDLSINDQESILELVIEKVMGYENAVAEYDDHDPNPETSLKKRLIGRSFCLVFVSSKNWPDHIF